MVILSIEMNDMYVLKCMSAMHVPENNGRTNAIHMQWANLPLIKSLMYTVPSNITPGDSLSSAHQ